MWKVTKISVDFLRSYIYQNDGQDELYPIITKKIRERWVIRPRARKIGFNFQIF